MTWLINVDNGGTTTGFCLVETGRPGPPAVVDLPAEADRVFAPSRPSLPPKL